MEDHDNVYWWEITAFKLAITHKGNSGKTIKQRAYLFKMVIAVISLELTSM